MAAEPSRRITAKAPGTRSTAHGAEGGSRLRPPRLGASGAAGGLSAWGSSTGTRQGWLGRACPGKLSKINRV